ncbi:MAG: DUF2948 family protein [Alphaproteobacteria bacterium]|jgi:hypothetical protein|nr:DUF2948 family protein [Alphaproteobacteria bacterium]MDP6564436.1 DUF2948 family protein [Alphaproteobacteria bacterium]MDP6813427.1 DUF2948 family protein [Alphaproteobacteria bacterium]
MITDRLLRLRAEDADDLEVVSACMQDAIARIGDMTYMSRLRRFALVATRFRWELAREVGPEGGQRIRSGLHFDDVLRVRSQGIDMADREGLLPLLAIRAEPAGERQQVTLEFAGGGAIRLEVEHVDCRLSDIDEGWPTPNRPAHDAGEAG